MPDPRDQAANVPTRRVHDRERHPRLARELATLRAMVTLHCHARHGVRDGLCAECDALMTYATRRLDRCVFGDDKPTCANCKVHCYNAAMRETVREVMRFAGPRMLLRHPLLAVAHLRDGRRPAPSLPQPGRE
ncbi:MAG: nitrous oxide-stimulated promoter family protein [Burkholderiales bacterium]